MLQFASKGIYVYLKLYNLACTPQYYMYVRTEYRVSVNPHVTVKSSYNVKQFRLHLHKDRFSPQLIKVGF